VSEQAFESKNQRARRLCAEHRQRTREALAVKKAQGVRLGRPQSISPRLARRIRSMRTRGLTLQRICDKLNNEGVPTPRGGSVWRPTSLRAVLRIR
jgi:DNA invertase Pin-like site-specific DNA recombinase